jgi:hypothetical protein
MSNNLNNAIVRIFKKMQDSEPNSEPSQAVGAGFLVSPHHILTCAHVVIAALFDNLNDPADVVTKPSGIIPLDFPLLEKQASLQATVVEWYPVKETYSVGEIGDICVLEISSTTSLPSEAQPVPIVPRKSLDFSGRKVRMFGFPEGKEDMGEHLNGILQGMTGYGWVQLKSEIGEGSVAPGFSGTAVWDKQENAVSGMMVSIYKNDNDENTAAYMIPAANLLKALPDSIELFPPSTVKNYAVELNNPRATIFLAEVTDDLNEQRDQVKRYLEQQNIKVVPSAQYLFQGNNATEDLRQAIEKDLLKSVLFVQLLSQVNPHRPPGMSTPRLQYESAKNIGLSILHWSHLQLDLTTITDSAQKAFLNSVQPMESSLEEFKQYIISQLEKVVRQKRLDTKPKDSFVFINIVPEDKNIADEIGLILAQQGIGFAISLFDNELSSEQKREIDEDNLQLSHATIMLCDKELKYWAIKELQRCLKMQNRRDSALTVIALFNKSPSKELVLGMRLPNMRFFDCATLTDNTCLPKFLQALQ